MASIVMWFVHPMNSRKTQKTRERRRDEKRIIKDGLLRRCPPAMFLSMRGRSFWLVLLLILSIRSFFLFGLDGLDVV